MKTKTAKLAILKDMFSNMKKKKHVHHFIDGRSKKIAVCSCGAFRHINLKPEDVITEIPVSDTLEHRSTENGCEEGCEACAAEEIVRFRTWQKRFRINHNLTGS